jgi:hypothetical protein
MSSPPLDMSQTSTRGSWMIAARPSSGISRRLNQSHSWPTRRKSSR